MKPNDTSHVPTQKLKFKGHNSVPREQNDRGQEIQLKKGEESHAHPAPDKETGKGGFDRYLFHDNDLGKEFTVEKGQTFTCSQSEAERILSDHPGSFEKVGDVVEPAGSGKK